MVRFHELWSCVAVVGNDCVPQKTPAHSFCSFLLITAHIHWNHNLSSVFKLGSNHSDELIGLQPCVQTLVLSVCLGVCVCVCVCEMSCMWPVCWLSSLCTPGRVVKEEISDENAKLPCFNGRVVSWVRPYSTTLTDPMSFSRFSVRYLYTKHISSGNLLPYSK